jgi:drug/metabolite transporter (DMT)-like permease
MVMLWKPQIGAPWPGSRAEWLGLVAGFLFALGNVLIRRLDTMTDAGKSIVIWAGVAAAALVHLPMASSGAQAMAAVASPRGWLVAGIGVVLVAMSLALQYGLARIPANRAIVILLSELVVAAIASYYLAGEMLGPRDALGAALIVGASVASGFRRD